MKTKRGSGVKRCMFLRSGIIIQLIINLIAFSACSQNAGRHESGINPQKMAVNKTEEQWKEELPESNYKVL
ncbi:MAG TPA: hypothetical protein PLP88_04315, partial [Bacteroidales bacterium]|nr:hypothetical protein [Bacteroidales bacterium]